MNSIKQLQADFDKQWIASGEICELLGVHRSTLCYHLKAGTLPDGVIVPGRGNGTMIWPRKQMLEIIKNWHS